MSKFIVLNPQSGLVISTHKNRELANKSARKLIDTHTTVIETDFYTRDAKKGDFWAGLTVFDDAQPAPAVEVTEVEVADDVKTAIVTRTSDGEKYVIEYPAKEIGFIHDDLITALEVGNISSYKLDANIPDGFIESNDADYVRCKITSIGYRATLLVETTEPEQTVSYTAKPSDSRCAWWSLQLPANIELNDQRIPAPYLRKGADLELKAGDMLIDSEAMHHRRNRGYNVVLIVCVDNEIKYIHPIAKRKAFIKAHGGQDLMHESGDVAGCVRMAVWLRRQPDLSAAVTALQNA